MGQIINSILDTDLYSFSIQYLYLQKFPRAKGTFKFKDRSNTVYPEGFAEKVMSEVRKMDNLSFKMMKLNGWKISCIIFLNGILQPF